MTTHPPVYPKRVKTVSLERDNARIVVESGLAGWPPRGHRSVASMLGANRELPTGAAICPVSSVVGEVEPGTTDEGLDRLHRIRGIGGVTNPFPARSRCRR